MSKNDFLSLTGHVVFDSIPAEGKEGDLAAIFEKNADYSTRGKGEFVRLLVNHGKGWSRVIVEPLVRDEVYCDLSAFNGKRDKLLEKIQKDVARLKGHTVFWDGRFYK